MRWLVFLLLVPNLPFIHAGLLLLLLGLTVCNAPPHAFYRTTPYPYLVILLCSNECMR